MFICTLFTYFIGGLHRHSLFSRPLARCPFTHRYLLYVRCMQPAPSRLPSGFLELLALSKRQLGGPAGSRGCVNSDSDSTTPTHLPPSLLLFSFDRVVKKPCTSVPDDKIQPTWPIRRKPGVALLVGGVARCEVLSTELHQPPHQPHSARSFVCLGGARSHPPSSPILRSNCFHSLAINRPQPFWNTPNRSQLFHTASPVGNWSLSMAMHLHRSHLCDRLSSRDPSASTYPSSPLRSSTPKR